MYENVLKFKPPLAFTRKDADTLVRTVDKGLTEWAAVRSGFWLWTGGWVCGSVEPWSDKST